MSYKGAVPVRDPRNSGHTNKGSHTSACADIVAQMSCGAQHFYCGMPARADKAGKQPFER